jgi:4-hydroxy-tetrahydrodipicolinate reductase
MRIALLGYGRMGREIEATAIAGGHEIVVRTDISSQELFNPATASSCDVAMEFTGPEAAADTILRALSYRVPVVSGSTGWLTRYDEVARYCREHGGAFIHSSNYSIGVNLLFRLNSELARIMRGVPGYSVDIEEVHHTAKLDAPSGTAITLAGQITGQQGGYNGWIRAEDGHDQGKIPIVSVRKGEVAGIHEVRWSSGEDTISLRHEALNRRGFATGALLAAGFISNRKGVYTMADVLNIL